MLTVGEPHITSHKPPSHRSSTREPYCVQGNRRRSWHTFRKMTNSQPLNDRVRILCLHGYRQNGDAFRAKIGSVRKHLQKYAELVFISAPHNVPVVRDESDDSASSGSNSADVEPTEKSWWFNMDDQKSFKGVNKNGPAFGYDTSLLLVEEAWRSYGPFQGLLGFSQGGCLVGLLCSLAMRGMTNVKPKFAIIASGFKSGSLAHANYYEDVISMPSLHIFGYSDAIIPSTMSRALADSFEDATIVEHPGGHYFAASVVQRQSYVEFVRRQLIEHLEEQELAKADETTTQSAKCPKESESSESD